ncbi:glutamine amidotransferase [Corynebacterium bovis]|uniref:Glutamine amidotransferase n=1 Tax=Corynebacterium bovis TaxID=36808 RepID=A0A426PY07_9CORY|nr:glutamine amidotransferase [Corynebacterium bovis]MDN8578890.1 glutamine amidotransferase [Corynebacterium bovis]RRO86233.1 glutamine amidotransferase [Corynebacterium bovis]RRO89726.1 glutamine amidotransferase [Corynebacterium bovis]
MSFILLSPRSGAEVAGAEYLDVLRATGLQPDELEQRVLDSPDSTPGPLDGADGVIVGGSPFTVTAPLDDTWQPLVSRRLVDLVTTAPVPVFLACYGASLLADSLGGDVVRTHPEQAGLSTVHLTDAAREDPVCAGLPPTFGALTGHTENVGRVPDGAVVLATGPTCPIQLYRWGDRVWTSQFHPEMDGAGMVRRMAFYPDHGYFDAGAGDEIAAALRPVVAAEAGQLLRNFVTHCRELAAGRGARGGHVAQASSTISM